jgi:D-alanine-D-alanine ligase
VKKKKTYTIAILYHYLPKSVVKQYFSSDHVITDQQTDETVRYVKKILQSRGYAVQVIRVFSDDLSNLKKLKADYVFNLVDSKKLEVKIIKILDRLKIPHSGATEEGIRISNNKIKTKRLFLKHNLPTPKYTVIRLSDRMKKSLLPCPFPVIVKPAFEHCSLGITERSVATNYKEFKCIVRELRAKFRQTLLAEEFIPGKELQVTVLENPEETLALPIAEIAYRGKIKNKWNIFGFDEKWRKELPVYKNCYFVSPPSKLKSTIDGQIRKDAIRAFYALHLKDYARFDLRYNPKNKQWYFLEANANAGIDPSPDDAMTASVKAYGLTVEDFIMRIVNNSLH